MTAKTQLDGENDLRLMRYRKKNTTKQEIRANAHETRESL